MHRAVITLVLVALLTPAVAETRERGVQPPGKSAVWKARHSRTTLLALRVGRTLRHPVKMTRRKVARVKRQVKIISKQATKIRLARTQLQTLSTSGLLVGSSGTIFNLYRAAGPLGGPFIGIGSLGLGYASIQNFRHAETAKKKAEALHGVAWSMQGMTTVGMALQSKFSWLAPASRALGVTGGALQAGVGAWRLAQGIKGKVKERIILGSLDMGGGACWAASACAIATPWTLGGFVALTTARMAYEHRDFLYVAGTRIKKKVSRKVRRARRKARVKVGRLTQRLQRFLGRDPHWKRPAAPDRRLAVAGPTP